MTTIPMLEEELEQAYKDIKYYKNRIERLNNQLQQKENKIEKLMELYTTEREVKDYYKNIINELEKSLKNLKGYYDQINFNTKAEFDDEEQVNRFWQEYGESKVVDYYFDKLQELKGSSNNE